MKSNFEYKIVNGKKEKMKNNYWRVFFFFKYWKPSGGAMLVNEMQNALRKVSYMYEKRLRTTCIVTSVI